MDSQNASKYVLVVNNKANNLEVRYDLEEGIEIDVGADPECPVNVEDEFISSRHFSVRVEGNKVLVNDLNSKNGLYLLLEGEEQIQPGQVLLAGKTLFKLEEGNEKG